MKMVWSPQIATVYSRSCQVLPTMAYSPHSLLNYSERTAADSLLSLGRHGDSPSPLQSSKRVREEDGMESIMRPRKTNALPRCAPYLSSKSRSQTSNQVLWAIAKDRTESTSKPYITEHLHRLQCASTHRLSPRFPPLPPRASNRVASVSPTSLDLETSPPIRRLQFPRTVVSVDDEELPILIRSDPALLTNTSASSSVKKPRVRKVNPSHEECDECENGVVPSEFDVLIGTGRTNSAHPGNRRFHKAIYENFHEYFEADYKKGVVDQAIASVHDNGGRFLAKGKKSQWVVVQDMDRLERNTRKSFHMAKKQRQRELSADKSGAVSNETSSRDNQFPQFYCGMQVVVYRETVGGYSIGKLEAQQKNSWLVRFNDPSNMAEWIDLTKAKCRVLSS